jgi:hypothetical protein
MSEKHLGILMLYEQKTACLLSCENEINCTFLSVCTLQFCELRLIITTLKGEGEICTISKTEAYTNGNINVNYYILCNMQVRGTVQLQIVKQCTLAGLW